MNNYIKSLMIISMALVMTSCGADEGEKKSESAPPATNQPESQKKAEKSPENSIAPGFALSKSKKFQMKIHWVDTPAVGLNTAHVEFLNSDRSAPDSITNLKVTAFMTGHGDMGSIPIKVAGHNGESSHKTVSNIDLKMSGNYTLSFTATVAGITDTVEIEVTASPAEDHSGHKH